MQCSKNIIAKVATELVVQLVLVVATTASQTHSQALHSFRTGLIQSLLFMQNALLHLLVYSHVCDVAISLKLENDGMQKFFLFCSSHGLFSPWLPAVALIITRPKSASINRILRALQF